MNLRDSGIGTSGFSLTFTFAGGSPPTRKPDKQIETEPVIDRSLR
jgi:hypothetical protein